MDLSFVILAWNSERYIGRCLAHIEGALRASGLSYEVRVLDNGSRDRTPDILAGLAATSGGHVIPRYEARNTGTTRARNQLLRATRGRHVCVMDSDVELRPGVIERLLPCLAGPEMGIVVPRIVYPTGAWQKSYDRFPTLPGKLHRAIRLKAIEACGEGADTRGGQPRFVDYAISAFWLMRRDLFDAVGMLDERIFYAPEDVDFCLRVWKAGRRILYVPTVCVVHHAQEISRGFRLNRAQLEHLRGLAYYFLKHRYLFRRPEFLASR